MGLDAATLPDHILRRMSKEDREPMGKAGLTTAEAVEIADAKSERELQADIANYLRTRGIEALVPAMHGRTRIKVGWPDFTFAYRGLPVCWEVKTPIGKLRPAQEAIIPRLTANGWRHAVIRSVIEAKRNLDAMDEIDHMDS